MDTTPNIILFFLFIFIVIFISMIGLYFFELILMCLCINEKTLNHTKTYILIVASLISIVLAFIIYNEYQSFYRAQLNVEEEATALSNLYKMVETLPGTRKTQEQIINYLKSIIYVEFPILAQNKTPSNNIILNELQQMIYNYHPHNVREAQLYQETVVSLNRAVNLRTARIDSAMTGITPEILWVVIFGIVVNIFITFFVPTNIYYKMFMTSLVAAVFASLLFLLVILDYPFSGEYSIPPQAFKLVLRDLSN